MKITMDEGYQFGLGVFETIAVENGKPLFTDWHLERLRQSLKVLGIKQSVSEKEIYTYLSQKECNHHALKIIASSQNIVFTLRQNPYTKKQLEEGFDLGFSSVYRNETSLLTRHKTLNYGDCILEKRHAKDLGVDELLFLNSKGEICEGTVSNVFFSKNGKLFTPSVSSGLLQGVVRRFLIENFSATEKVLKKEDVTEMDECFVTNSLMGIMPVKSLNGIKYSIGKTTKICQDHYQEILQKNLKI